MLRYWLEPPKISNASGCASFRKEEQINTCNKIIQNNNKTTKNGMKRV